MNTLYKLLFLLIEGEVPKYVRLAQKNIDYYVPLKIDEFESFKVNGLPKGAIALANISLAKTFDTNNREKFRPEYHFSPLYGWMNDPNGMVYANGTYHLYYQHNPYGSTWQNMSWGHATSEDLVNWKHQPVAIVPDEHGAIFSGSAILDKENSAGFGEDAIIAFYTSHNPDRWR